MTPFPLSHKKFIGGTWIPNKASHTNTNVYHLTDTTTSLYEECGRMWIVVVFSVFFVHRFIIFSEIKIVWQLLHGTSQLLILDFLVMLEAKKSHSFFLSCANLMPKPIALLPYDKSFFWSWLVSLFLLIEPFSYCDLVWILPDSKFSPKECILDKSYLTMKLTLRIWIDGRLAITCFPFALIGTLCFAKYTLYSINTVSIKYSDCPIAVVALYDKIYTKLL